MDYFNYAYFEILPLSFLWTEQVVQSLAVGMTVGIYGLAANHSGEEERAFILGRMDACLSVTAIFGFALASFLRPALCAQKENHCLLNR